MDSHILVVWEAKVIAVRAAPVLRGIRLWGSWTCRTTHGDEIGAET